MSITEASRLALKGRVMGKTAVVIIGGLIGLGILAAAHSGPSTAQTPPTPEQLAAQSAKGACYKDWHACADNAMLANSNNATYQRAHIACKMQAESTAKYGSPTFPWFAFSTFYTGDEYIRTGIAVLVEKDAQFQNMYGAMAHSTVICQYDMNKNDDISNWTKNVVNISVVAN
jgi:hypothetical protein